MSEARTRKPVPIYVRVLGLCISLAIFGTVAAAQETGGALIGGAGIFRPKNPEAKRTSNPNRPTRPRPNNNTVRVDPAEVEEKFQNLISDGNDARDARKYSAAETAYHDATRLKPQDTRGFQGLGNVFVDQSRWEEAEQVYRKAVEFAPTNPDALIALSYVLVQPRTGALNARRFADAENFARRAVQLAPNNAVAFDRLGVAMVARGLVNADTEAAFRHAVELDPNNVVAQVHLARALIRLKRNAEAEPIFKAAIDKAQQDAPTLVLIADSMQAEYQWRDSEPVLRRALQLDPRNPGALYLLGRYLTASQKYSDAEPILRSAVEVNPKFFNSRNILGRVYLALDRYDDAFKTYEEASTLAAEADRRDLAGNFGFTGVGDGYMKGGRPKDALRAYDRALQIDPSNAGLQEKITAARAKVTP
jgi:cytochrome c-type biogenesis protein CcmH/NrfG